jgi:hypothetical protein
MFKENSEFPGLVSVIENMLKENDEFPGLVVTKRAETYLPCGLKNETIRLMAEALFRELGSEERPRLVDIPKLLLANAVPGFKNLFFLCL